MKINPRRATWFIILIIFLVLGSLRPSPAAQAQPLRRPAEVYSPPINRWRTTCIACPYNFYTLTSHSLHLDSAGQARIAYGGDAFLYYAWQDNTAWPWQSEIVDKTSLADSYASLELDAADNPHIAYFVGSLPTEVRYAYKDASGWHIETVDDSGQASGFPALALDTSGFAHIVYYGNSALQYAYQDAGGWHTQTIDSKSWVGQYNSIALDAQGYAHVSYYDASADSDLRYAYQDAGGWHIQVVDAEGAAGQATSLALDASGCPHITYYEGVGKVVKYAYQPTCPAEGGWQIQAIGAAGVSMGSTSLALDASGYAHVSCYNDDDNSLTYTYQDAGGWHASVLATGAGYNSSFTSLAWNESTGVHIAYNNGSGLIHVYFDPFAGYWEYETVDTISAGSSLAIDGEGILHIAYRTNGPGLRYASRLADGWQVQIVDGISDPYAMALDDQGYPYFCYGGSYTYQDTSGWHSELFDAYGGGYACAIAVDSQHYPHIVYYSSPWHAEAWYYAYKDAEGWHTVALGFYGDYSLTLDDQDYPHILTTHIYPSNGLVYYYQDAEGLHSTVIEDGYFQYGSLALDANGYGHASYYDIVNGALKYAHQDANGWHTETVDDEGDPGKYTDIAVDAAGYPHISYHDHAFGSIGNLKYASQDASGWHLQTVDASYGAGFSTSIVLDDSGEPYISYHDEATYDLLLAYPLTNLAYLPTILKGYQQPHRLKLCLDEAAGATAFADASGSNHPAWCAGASCPTAGQPGVRGTAVQFDGLDDFITLGNPAGLNFTGRVTLEAWVWLQSTTGVQDILAHGYTLTPERELFLRLSNGMYQAGSWDGTGHYAAFAIPAEDIGTWVYLAGVYDGAYWRLYRNGVEVGASAQPQGALLVDANWAVGAAGSGTERFFSGRLDEVNLYARALPAEEIWQHYQNTLR